MIKVRMLQTSAAIRARRGLPAASWDRATGVLFLSLVALAAATASDFGPTWDEGFQREIGQAVVAWYRTGFQDRTALAPGTTGNYHLYGGLFEAQAELAALALPLEPFHARHLVTALWSLAGLLGAGLLARRLAGARAGFAAVALLAATGAWWGHGFANSKDIPFAAPYPWILLALLSAADALPRLAPGRLAGAGLALGLALGVRPAGVLMLLPLAAGVWGARGLAWLMALPAAERARAAWRLVGALAAVVALAWAVMLVGWPWGQLGPLTRPFQAAVETARTAAKIDVHFAGQWYPSTDLPRSYLPTWLVSTLPEAWLVAALLTAGAAPSWWRGARLAGRLDGLLVAGAAGLPLVAAVVARPPLYDGIRHVLFVLPALAAVLAAGASRALDLVPRAAAVAAAGALGAAWLLAAVDLARLHPYEYVSFNRLVAGGVARGVARYEGDYWSTSAREGLRWLVDRPDPGAGRPLRVAVTGPPSLVTHWLPAPGAWPRFLVAQPWEADVLLSTTRWFRHRAPGRVLHVVERAGAPLLYVIALPGPDEAGARRLEAGDATLDLPLPAGWSVDPSYRVGDARTRYGVTSVRGSELELVVMTPGNGAVSTDEELRQMVAAQCRREAGGAALADLERLEGPMARGWSARWRTAGGAEERLVAAVRTGAVAALVSGGCAPGEPADLLVGLAGARQGPAPERSP